MLLQYTFFSAASGRGPVHGVLAFHSLSELQAATPTAVTPPVHHLFWHGVWVTSYIKCKHLWEENK